MSEIQIYREDNPAITKSNFEILVNGKKVGEVGPEKKEKISLKNPNPDSKIQLRVSWYKTKPLRFSPEKKGTTHFHCGSDINQNTAIFEIIAITLLFVIIDLGVQRFLMFADLNQFIAYFSLMIVIYLFLIKEIVFHHPLIYIKQTKSKK